MSSTFTEKPASAVDDTVSPMPYVPAISNAPPRSSISHTTRFAGSTIQYSLTPCLEYNSNLSRQSRLVDDGDRISTTRSGAPRMLAGVRMRARALDTNSRLGGLRRGGRRGRASAFRRTSAFGSRHRRSAAPTGRRKQGGNDATPGVGQVGIIRLAFGGGGLVFHAGRIPSCPSFIKNTLRDSPTGEETGHAVKRLVEYCISLADE